MMWTNNPERDATRHEWEQEDAMAKLPTCDCCGYRITDDHFYDIFGKFICSECMDDCKRYTDDYTEGMSWAV